MPAPKLPTKPDDPRHAEVIERFLSGETQASIAAAYGVAQPTLSAWLLRRGYRRDAGDAERRKWARMSDDQRAAQVKAAHAATRGVAVNESVRIKRAATVERLGKMTRAEEALRGWIVNHGGPVMVPQVAVGKYNLDLSAGPVAVELFGGGWHAYGKHGASLLQRTRDVFDAGWHLYIIWTHTSAHPLLPEVADDVVAFYEQASRNPAAPREYRVVWGDGQVIAAGSADDNHWTLVPTGIRGAYART